MTLTLSSAACSDVGRQRDENQDAYGALVASSAHVFVVCDGLGGYRGGATASRMAVACIEERFLNTEGATASRIEATLQRANRLVHDAAQNDPELYKMATTAVVLVVDTDRETAEVAHVGDSRAYLVRGSTIRQLTRDHTVVQRLVDEGVLDAEAAKNHPHGNVISRSIGGESAVEVEHGDAPVNVLPGDVFVLCSDGLHGLVDAEEVARAVRAMPAEEAATTLVARANEYGGHDNITVQIVVVEPAAGPIRGEISVAVPPQRPRSPLAPPKRRTTVETPVQLPAADTTEPAEPLAPEPPVTRDEAYAVTAAPERVRTGDGNLKFVVTAVLAGLLVAAIGVAIMLVMERDRRAELPPPAAPVPTSESEGSGV
jgi:PPM family protein phosphatase